MQYNALFFPVPLPTYILGPSSPSEVSFYQGLSRDGGELCPNLTCLGMHSTVYFSSAYQATSSLDAISCQFCLSVIGTHVISFSNYIRAGENAVHAVHITHVIQTYVHVCLP